MATISLLKTGTDVRTQFRNYPMRGRVTGLVPLPDGRFLLRFTTRDDDSPDVRRNVPVATETMSRVKVGHQVEVSWYTDTDTAEAIVV